MSASKPERAGGWVHFVSDFDFCALGGRVTVAYRAGMRLRVTAACLDAAIGHGKAVAIAAPKAGRHGR